MTSKDRYITIGWLKLTPDSVARRMMFDAPWNSHRCEILDKLNTTFTAIKHDPRLHLWPDSVSPWPRYLSRLGEAHFHPHHAGGADESPKSSRSILRGTIRTSPRYRPVQMVCMHQQLCEQKQPPGFGRRLGHMAMVHVWMKGNCAFKKNW